MSETLSIAITGASGRMGQMLIKNILKDRRFEICGVTEHPGHEWIGSDIGEMMGGEGLGLTVSADPLEVFAKARAVIDFTSPSASITHANLAAQARCVHVIGTTGFSKEQIEKLTVASRHAVIVRAGNMSLGVNLLVQLTKKVSKALDEDFDTFLVNCIKRLTKKVSKALDEDFDIEVIESHHRMKVDAPSGTALMLGEAAADGRGKELSKISDRGRDGITGPRKRGDIGFTAIRGGDVVGEHDVIFAAAGERVTLRHVATDRSIFVRGALKAAIWGQSQKPGEYDMLDVLNLS